MVRDYQAKQQTLPQHSVSPPSGLTSWRLAPQAHFIPPRKKSIHHALFSEVSQAPRLLPNMKWSLETGSAACNQQRLPARPAAVSGPIHFLPNSLWVISWQSCRPWLLLNHRALPGGPVRRAGFVPKTPQPPTPTLWCKIQFCLSGGQHHVSTVPEGILVAWKLQWCDCIACIWDWMVGQVI